LTDVAGSAARGPVGPQGVDPTTHLGPAGFETLTALLGQLLSGFDEGDAHPQH
jgi:hypothetical protein